MSPRRFNTGPRSVATPRRRRLHGAAFWNSPGVTEKHSTQTQHTHTHTQMVSHVASKDCDPKTLRDSPRCFDAALLSIFYFGILWNTRSDDMGTKLPRAPALWTPHFDFSSSLSSSSLKPQDQTAARNATPPARWQARGCAAFFFFLRIFLVSPSRLGLAAAWQTLFGATDGSHSLLKSPNKSH